MLEHVGADEPKEDGREKGADPTRGNQTHVLNSVAAVIVMFAKLRECDDDQAKHHGAHPAPEDGRFARKSHPLIWRRLLLHDMGLVAAKNPAEAQADGPETKQVDSPQILYPSQFIGGEIFLKYKHTASDD